MVDKKKATPQTDRPPSRATPAQVPVASQMRRRFATDAISGFENVARPPRRLTRPGPAPRSTKEYGDLGAVREVRLATRRADARSEEPAVRDFVPEPEVGEGGVATPPRGKAKAKGKVKLSLGAVPRRRMGVEELRTLPLDHRDGFVLAHIDGKTSLRTLLDVCGMSHDEIARVLERLLEVRAIDVA